MSKVTRQDYERWLKSSYTYYWGIGDSQPTMSDHEWDTIAKKLNPEDYAELKGTGYVPGQSLFWLSKDKYPDWAKE